MTEYVTAWECIGCGRIEAPRPCIGVCQDRKAEFVYARQYEEAIARAERSEREMKIAKDVLARLIKTTPQAGQWERCYRAFQSTAAKAIAACGS
ncbi:MAG TPA: hypothetical protein VKU03_10110 [Roseiarcus sp.]|nr:hypothetical protein [Roseiarcus sp.]